MGAWDVPFERYRIDGVLGEGGQAVVLEAFDLRLNVPRALKVMLPHAARHQRLRDRFEREAQLLAALEHPNVVRVFDVRVDGPVPWFVMELVRGGTLVDRLLSDGALPPHLVSTVVDQLAAGLGAAHALGVVHRDVKPGNVLVAPGGVCKLVDFGIARFEELGQTKAGTTMGTQGFMAPEQSQDASSVDRRADVYGLGMSAYVLLTRREPWEWIAGERDAVPPALVDALVHATARNRAERFDTTEAFAAAFRTAVAALPPDPPGTTLVRPFTPRRTSPEVLAARLDEVRGWFVPPRPAPAPPAPPAPSPATRSGVGYTMSRPRGGRPRAADGVPDWISEEPAPRTLGRASVEGMVAVSPPPAPPPAPPPPPARSLPTWILVAVAALALSIGLGTGAVWYVQWQHHVAEVGARDRLVRVVRENLPVLSLLAELGADRTQLEALAVEFEAAPSERTRAERAAAIVEVVAAETERLADPGSARRQELDTAVAAMRSARDAWRASAE